ncbi:MAG: hypothetical protein AB8B63_23775 [Granulosicoccus sp.]
MNNFISTEPADIRSVLSRSLRCASNSSSLSDTFVDTAFTPPSQQSSNSDERLTATLSQLESAFGTPGSASPRQQARFLFQYLGDFLKTDSPFRRLLDILSESAQQSCSENRKTSDNLEDFSDDFLRLLPALDMLEREPLDAEFIDALPPEAKGFAMYSLTSALRYGACLELVYNVIQGTAALDDDGNSIERCEVARLGKIQQWEFDPVTRAGSLFVEDMKVDRYSFRYDDALGIVKATLVEQWSYDWKVEVSEGGYTLAKRLSQRDFLPLLEVDPNADPFVDNSGAGSVSRPALPAEAKDFLNPDSIWGRGLTGRLFASGESINVASVTGTLYAMTPTGSAGAVADTGTAYAAIDGREYYRNHVIEGNVVFGPNTALRQTTEDSCIDIMFALSESGEFPVSIEEFPATQRGWCLGRCKHPLIANSR